MVQSYGERKIASFLDKYEIPYTYQPPLLVNDQGYQRIWYPDFGLTKYGMFIEYFGVINNPEYDQRTHYKLKAYQNSDISVIALYPDDLRGNYEKNTLMKIRQTLYSRVSDLEQRITQNYQPNRQYNSRPKFNSNFRMKDKYR